jgi:hypothetical protein
VLKGDRVFAWVVGTYDYEYEVKKKKFKFFFSFMKFFYLGLYL